MLFCLLFVLIVGLLIVIDLGGVVWRLFGVDLIIWVLDCFVYFGFALGEVLASGMVFAYDSLCCG